MDWINAQYSRITFQEELPEDLQTGHVLENVDWTPDFTMSACICRNNRARGCLISTPGNVVVENNRIASSGAGVKISGDANYWFESGAVRDVLIRNNEFGDCCYGPIGWGRAVIEIDPEILDPEGTPECFHQNIRIENNRFCTFDVGILFARSVEGLTFSDNTISRTSSYPMTHRMGELLTFECCENIRISDNKVDTSISEPLCSDLNAGNLR